MSKPPAFQFYADDFLGGVADMTQAEVGAYMLLLCYQWNRGEIPTDPARAALIAKGEVSAHLMSKFPGGKNPRLERVRAEQEAFRNKQAEAGARGASKRWGRGQNNGDPNGDPNGVAMATPMATPMARAWPDDSSPSPSPTPINTPLPPKGGGAVDSLPGIDPVPTEPAKPTVPAKGPMQLRAERIFRRRESTPLSKAERRAFAGAKPTMEATPEEDWSVLEAYYRAGIAPDKDIRRCDLAQLINNWNGEIDRAKAWAAKTGFTPSAASGTTPLASIPEPPGWREFVASEYPRCDYAPGQPKHGMAWAEIPHADAKVFADAMQRASLHQ